MFSQFLTETDAVMHLRENKFFYNAASKSYVKRDSVKIDDIYFINIEIEATVVTSNSSEVYVAYSVSSYKVKTF